MHNCKVLVVDDDQDFVSAVEELLVRRGYEVKMALSGKEALDKLGKEPLICIVLTDLVMPLMDGFSLLEKLRELNPEINVIMITGHGTVPKAVEAMKQGATDFITKPFDKDVLLKKLDIIRKAHELRSRVTELEEMVSEKYGFDYIVSSSKVMKSVFDKASAAADSDAPIFIVGETGTGKELLAKAIHLKSQRREQPFIPVNCAAIPKELMEAELFGYKKGSFTGAIRDHNGLFVAANRGTIFLDEISEMPKELQAKILRVLEDYIVRPIGETKGTLIDVRVIAASNKPTPELKNKYLREDLFFRLAVIVIELPPLRYRKEDIPPLAEYFINKFNQKYSKVIKYISERGFEFLFNYSFPGNIRELENLIESIIAVSQPEKTAIDDKDLKTHLLWKEARPQESTVLSLEKLEKYAIKQALRETQGNKTKAAELLGVSRDTLYRKLKQLGIES